MAHRGRSSANERLALLIASGLTIRAAAKKAKISERTARRRVNDPDFAKRVAELRAGMTSEALGILSRSLTAAANRLRTLVKHPKGEIATRACKVIIDAQSRLRQSAEFEERLAALEKNR